MSPESGPAWLALGVSVALLASLAVPALASDEGAQPAGDPNPTQDPATIAASPPSAPPDAGSALSGAPTDPVPEGVPPLPLVDSAQPILPVSQTTATDLLPSPLPASPAASKHAASGAPPGSSLQSAPAHVGLSSAALASALLRQAAVIGGVALLVVLGLLFTARRSQ